MNSVVLFTTPMNFYKSYLMHKDGYDHAGYGVVPCYTNIPMVAWFYDSKYNLDSMKYFASISPCDDELISCVSGIDEAIECLIKRGYESVIVC